MTDREQEAIDRMAAAMKAAWVRDDYGYGAQVALDVLLSPSPCPTCGGTGGMLRMNMTNELVREPPMGRFYTRVSCPDCTDGTVPPLLRWNEEA